MSSSYGIRIVLPLPVTGQVQWDGPLNDLLQALLDVLAQRVTVDGLDIGAALDMQGNALINALNIQFVTGGDPGVPNSIYYSGGELFVRDGSNRAIQLTSGGIVNVGGSGGFGGDYVSSNQNGASYTNATQTFTFTSAGGTSYATIEGGELKVHSGANANSVGLKSAAALASSIEFTLPTGLPNGPGLLRVDGTGTMGVSVSGTFKEYWPIVPALTAGTVTSLSPGTQTISSGGSISFGFPCRDGDTLIDFSFKTDNAQLTASVTFQGEGGSTQVARVALNTQTGIITINGSTPTLTGSMPFTPSVYSGSFFVSLQAAAGGPDRTITAFATTKRKKLIP